MVLPLVVAVACVAMLFLICALGAIVRIKLAGRGAMAMRESLQTCTLGAENA